MISKAKVLLQESFDTLVWHRGTEHRVAWAESAMAGAVASARAAGDPCSICGGQRWAVVDARVPQKVRRGTVALPGAPEVVFAIQNLEIRGSVTILCPACAGA